MELSVSSPVDAHQIATRQVQADPPGPRNPRSWHHQCVLLNEEETRL